MATVNLGRIKPQWQGSYASETSYVIDDMVLYNNSAYICTAASQGNAPTDTNYWDLMTQGSDIPSGGSNGQVLTNDGSDNLSWATAFSGDAAELTSGTIPDARFPATLPALDGSALTGTGRVLAMSNVNIVTSQPSWNAEPTQLNGLALYYSSQGSISCSITKTSATSMIFVYYNYNFRVETGGNGQHSFVVFCEQNSNYRVIAKDVTRQAASGGNIINISGSAPFDGMSTGTYTFACSPCRASSGAVSGGLNSRKESDQVDVNHSWIYALEVEV